MEVDLLQFEKKYHNYIVAGIDEAGRGPLAGPVVASAVILDNANIIPGIKDSKKLSKKKWRVYLCAHFPHSLTYIAAS